MYGEQRGDRPAKIPAVKQQEELLLLFNSWDLRGTIPPLFAVHTKLGVVSPFDFLKHCCIRQVLSRPAKIPAVKQQEEIVNVMLDWIKS